MNQGKDIEYGRRGGASWRKRLSKLDSCLSTTRDIDDSAAEIRLAKLVRPLLR